MCRSVASGNVGRFIFQPPCVPTGRAESGVGAGDSGTGTADRSVRVKTAVRGKDLLSSVWFGPGFYRTRIAESGTRTLFSVFTTLSCALNPGANHVDPF